MLNDTRTMVNPFGPAANTSYPRLKGVNTNRQARFEARAARRWGDWDDYLIFPTPLLWLETVPALCFDDECVFVPPAIVELWP